MYLDMDPLKIFSFLIDIFISYIGFFILKYSFKKIKNGFSSPFYFFSFFLSIFYFIPTFILKSYIYLQIYFEQFNDLKELNYYSILKNLDSQVYLLYSVCNIVFALLVLNLLPFFSKKYIDNNKLLELKIFSNFKNNSSKNKKIFFRKISNIFILPFIAIFLLSLTLIPLIVSANFSSIWALRNYISNFILLSQGENSIYFLIIRIVASLGPAFLCSAYVFGNRYQKILVSILSLSLLLTFTKLPFILFLSLVAFEFSKKSFFVQKTYREIKYYLKIKTLFVLSLLTFVFTFVYTISSNTGFKWNFIINSLTRFTFATHGSNLTKLYYWQLNGYQNLDIGGSRISAIFNGVGYQPSNYFLDISDALYGVEFGDTSSFVSLSILRGGFLLFLIELILVLSIPVIFDLFYKSTNSLALRYYLRFASIYYVFLLISIESQTLFTHHLFGYTAILLLFLYFLKKSFRYIIN